MGFGDTEAIEGLLKYVYYEGKRIPTLMSTDAVLWNRMKVSDRAPGGKGFEFPVTVSLAQDGVGAISENGSLHGPGSAKPIKGLVTPKINTTTIGFSGKALDVATGGDTSFVEDNIYQSDLAFIALNREQNCQLFRDGTGRVADVNGAVSNSTTVNFDNGIGTHFMVGELLDFINSSNVIQASGVKIQAVNPYANTLTLETAISCDDNCHIFRHGISTLYAGSDLEMEGLPNAADNGALSTTYENIDRSVWNNFDGITIDAGGALLVDDLMQAARGRTVVNGGFKPNLVIMNSDGQLRRYISNLVPMKQYYNDSTPMDSGVTGLEKDNKRGTVAPLTWNGVEVVEDVCCGFDEIYMYAEGTQFGDAFERYSVYKPRFDDRDGKIVKQVPLKYQFYSYAIALENSGTMIPNSVVRIKNLAKPDQY